MWVVNKFELINSFSDRVRIFGKRMLSIQKIYKSLKTKRSLRQILFRA